MGKREVEGTEDYKKQSEKITDVEPGMQRGIMRSAQYI